MECCRKKTQEAGVAVTKGSVTLALNARLRILLERSLEIVEEFKLFFLKLFCLIWQLLARHGYLDLN